MTTSPTSFRPIYSWFVVGLATIAYILSNVDRQLISILISPIQRDLGLNDTEFGTLQGIAYGLFYAAFCIPIASFSDRSSRSIVMSAGLALWSAATMACGAASNFVQLFVARAIVGMGEASLLPAVYSLIGDLFPREKLGRAMGVYSLAPFLGSTGAFVLGGLAFHWLGENGNYTLLGAHLHTWQITFLMAAAPGLLLALIIFLFVHDPRTANKKTTARVSPPPFREVLHFLGTKRDIFIPHLVGFPMLGVTLYATLAWAPAFLIRTEGFSSAQAGLWLGSASLFAGGGGALIAGLLTDALVTRRHGAGPFEVGMIAAIALGVGAAWLLFIPTRGSALIVITGAFFFGSFVMAPSVSVIQSIVPSPLRSRVSGIFLVINIFWQTVGSFLIGFLNDHAFGGPHGIRISLPLFIGTVAVGALIFLSFGRKPMISAMAGITKPCLRSES